MHKTTTILLTLSLGMLALTSHADNPNPKPNCPLGQLAVFDGTNWECKQPDMTSGEKSPAEVGLLLPAVQKASEAASRNSTSAQPTAPKPTCPLGQIAKLELGHWQCHPLHLTSEQKKQPTGVMKPGDIKNGTHTAGPPAGPRPTCQNGMLPKIVEGHWVCKQPDLTSQQKPEL